MTTEQTLQQLATKNIKVKSLRVINIKNVKHGYIEFHKQQKINHVTGVYGQNGSGKTALVDAFEILRSLMRGKKMDNKILDLIPTSEPATLELLLDVHNEREVFYTVTFERANHDVLHDINMFNDDNKETPLLKIRQETLETKTLEKGNRRKMLLGYDSTNVDYPLMRKNIFPKNITNASKLEFVKAMSITNQESFIFGKGMKKFIQESDEQHLDELKTVLNIVTIFSRSLNIYSNAMSGLVNIHSIMPLQFNLGFGTAYGASGVIAIQADESTVLSAVKLKFIELLFEQINGVLPNIIPGLTIEIQLLEERVNKQHETEYKVAFLANRSGEQFPLRCESDGIKKIISLLALLVNVFNNHNSILVVDELDSGIFEFLLGELLTVLSSNAKGMLIFTSHNLRALEVLSYEEIIFTTTNADNRYIRMNNVKQTNNLRGLYLRAIQLGGLDEELYVQTDTVSIENSFRRTFSKMKKRLKEMQPLDAE